MPRTAENESYEYQDQVYDTFLAGHNIILQAPTGAGKTRAALRPGLHGLTQDYRLYPQTIIYGAPLRTLVHSQHQEIQQTAKANRKWRDYDLQPTVQTGQQPNDPKFEGPIIFATVDQMLASFLNIPYGLPSRLGNINTGAFAGAYLIFDEFHLYPTEQMLLSVIAMLKMLDGISRFTLMTATFSLPVLHKLQLFLNAKGIADPQSPLGKGLFSDIKQLQHQERTWVAQPGVITSQEIHHALDQGDRVLVICNTVDRAQTLYADFMESSPPDDVQIKVLHSRFYQADRHTHETEVIRWLGKDGQNLSGRYVVIATQVIEVGLDISADILLTECAPAASLIQRAGRCVRWGGNGQVWVYQPPVDAQSGTINYAPYHDEGLLDVSQKTWDALTSSQFNNQVVRYDGEQTLINLAHSDHDVAYLLHNLENRIDQRIDEITQCMRRRDPGFRNQLIRKNVQASLYIAANPLKDLQSPFEYESFSVSQGRIARAFEEIGTADTEADFYFCGAVEVDADVEDIQRGVEYKWPALQSGADAYQYWQFAAHPRAVAYDPHIGLRWTNPKGIDSPESPKVGRHKKPYAAYKVDTYVEHVVSLLNAYRKPASSIGYSRPLRQVYAYPLQRVLETLGQETSTEQIDRMVSLTLALHDVGKLNHRWQRWIQTWQRVYAAHIPNVRIDGESDLLAHSDTELFGDERVVVKAAFDALKVPSRGSHAVESVLASLPILQAVTNDNHLWFDAIIAAICQHHTPGIDASKAMMVTLHADAQDAIYITLQTAGFDTTQALELTDTLIRQYRGRPDRKIRRALKKTQMEYSEFRIPLLYYLLVRILRLADHRSSEYLPIYPVEGE